MKHEGTRQLFRYWNGIRGERASPERDEVEPSVIRDVLADTFVIENRQDGTFPIRLCGTRVDALWLANLKDRCFLDLWGDDRHSVAAALWTVMDGTAPLVVGAKAVPHKGPAADAEALLLPLRHNGRTHKLILGTITLAEPTPWIGLRPVERLRLISLRVLGTDAVDLPVARPPPTGMAPGRMQTRGHLTVYAGGR